MKKLVLNNDSDGIDFYMLTKQFQRVASKIEQIHDALLKDDCNGKKAIHSLEYYQNEKTILLGKMKAILDRLE